MSSLRVCGQKHVRAGGSPPDPGSTATLVLLCGGEQGGELHLELQVLIKITYRRPLCHLEALLQRCAAPAQCSQELFRGRSRVVPHAPFSPRLWLLQLARQSAPYGRPWDSRLHDRCRHLPRLLPSKPARCLTQQHSCWRIHPRTQANVYHFYASPSTGAAGSDGVSSCSIGSSGCGMCWDHSAGAETGNPHCQPCA